MAPESSLLRVGKGVKRRSYALVRVTGVGGRAWALRPPADPPARKAHETDWVPRNFVSASTNAGEQQHGLTFEEVSWACPSEEASPSHLA